MYSVYFFLTVLCCLLFVDVQYSWARMQVYLRPGLTVSEEYTDNVGLTEDDEESEWITAISPRLTLDLVGKTQDLYLSYSPGFVYYADREENNTVRHSADLNYRAQVAKQTVLTVRDSFVRTEKPYDPENYRLRFPDQAEDQRLDYTIRRNREPHSSNAATINLSHRFGKKDNLNFGYRFYRLWDQSPRVEDSREHSPYFNVSHWLTPQLGLTMSTRYTRGEFEGDTDTFNRWTGSVRVVRNFTKFFDGYAQYTHTVLDHTGETEDYQVYDPSLGIAWRFAEDTNLGLGLGYYIRDREQSGSNSGLYIKADLSKGWDISRRTSIRFTGGSGYEQTYFGAENLGFTKYYEGRARLTHALSRRLDSDVSVIFRRNEYTDRNNREDDIWSFQGALHWVMREWAVLSLEDTYRIVDSNLERREYKENRIILSLSLHPKPFLFK